MYLPAFGQKRLKEALDTLGSPSAVLNDATTLGRRAAIARNTPDVLAPVERALKVIDTLDVRVLLMGDGEYPAALRHLEDPPPVLFTRGRIELLQRTIVAVVGSRDCTEYGRDMTQVIVPTLARAGVVIASGLARGIDGHAHAAALDAGGDTIAVLGCGIDICYPRSNRALYDRIATDGLLLTEFPPETTPYPGNFPHRNRIIGMMSNGIVVIEATVDGGALSAAARVNGFGDISIMAVPGPVGRPTSEGTNYLIRDGAHLVTSGADVLSYMGIKAPKEEPGLVTAAAVGERQQRVLAALTGEPAHLDRIVERANLPVGEVTLTLLELELAGCARQLPGVRYARKA